MWEIQKERWLEKKMPDKWMKVKINDDQWQYDNDWCLKLSKSILSVWFYAIDQQNHAWMMFETSIIIHPIIETIAG